jgi:hypothetical protein
MPDGRKQEPGGWNRVVLQVTDLPSRIEALKRIGLHFRNEMEVGPRGKQIQLEDPDGNPIELFEPVYRLDRHLPGRVRPRPIGVTQIALVRYSGERSHPGIDRRRYQHWMRRGYI